MKLVQISDCHIFSDKLKPGYDDINPFNSFYQVVDRVEAEQPDLVLLTGDLSGDGSLESYLYMNDLLDDVLGSIPYWVLPGNHDNLALLRKVFTNKDLSVSEPLSIGNWYIHGLNSKFQGNLGQVDVSQLDNLRVNIERAPTKNHLIAVHHHPIECRGWMDKHEWLNRAEFLRFIEKFDRVRAVIYGHIHTESAIQLGQVQYLSCPSTCWQWSCEPNFATTRETPGYRVMHLDEQGNIDTLVKRI